MRRQADYRWDFVKIIIMLSVTILFTGILIPTFLSVKAGADELPSEGMVQVENNSIGVENFNEIANQLNLEEQDITSRYTLKESGVGIINAHDKDSSEYYNLYIVDGEIKYISSQEKLGDNSATFNLYEVNTESGEFDPAMSLRANSNGELINTRKRRAINNAAFKWACIFSSYVACAGVAAGAGAAGSLVSGPFGAAMGFAGGAACRYLFQTAVTKYGSKQKACSILAR